MELAKIEALLEKYFQGETSLQEETILRKYFSSSNVASHLTSYQSLFGYFEEEETIRSHQVPQIKPKNHWVMWGSIAASVLLFLSLFFFWNNEKAIESKVTVSEYGTYESPEAAYKATQKALALLSQQVNIGIESVQYLDEYKNTKQLIFKD